MTRFSAEIEDDIESGLQIVNLIDQKESIRVQIIPELGNNLVSLTIAYKEQDLELIYIPTEIKNLKSGDYQFYGNPILFPFPGRIPKGEFHTHEQKFQVPINFQDGTAIHGFVYDKKWEVSEISAPSNKEVFLKSTYISGLDIAEFFPFPFQIEMTYTLGKSELELTFQAKNTGELAFPFGYGIHPYFLIRDNRKDWVLYLPANEIYELIDFIPTGHAKKIHEPFDFRTEKSLKNIYLDDLFGKITKDKNGFASCMLKNRASGFNLTVISDPNFEYYVLYAPKDNDFICIEPYTCIPNAFNLIHSGFETGLRMLEPNETFETRIWFKWKI